MSKIKVAWFFFWDTLVTAFLTTLCQYCFSCTGFWFGSCGL